MSIKERGGALLTVLWLSAALSAIAFSVATTVRGETERAGTHIDRTRAYFLATAALDRALLWMQWGPGHRHPDGTPVFYEPGMPILNMQFPTGVAQVEVIPESSKLNVNRATPVELNRLLLAIGLPPERAQAITQAIVDWRTEQPGPGPLDAYYLALTPSFRARHSSLDQIEELLYVRGVASELFYGTWARNDAGMLTRLPGLKDCLTVYGTNNVFDINFTAVPVMVAIGVPPDAAAAIAARRAVRPFFKREEIGPFAAMAGGRLGLGGNSIYTLRATATLRSQNPMALSDVRRSAAMVLRFNNDRKADPEPYWIMRWYDNAGTN